jgi:hypothetical protein
LGALYDDDDDDAGWVTGDGCIPLFMTGLLW